MSANQIPNERRPDAVVWIDERHAIVARREPAGGISTIEVRRHQRPEARYLGDIVHEIGDHEHVMLVGAPPIRLALERRFVAVYRRPERLMAPAPAARVDGARIVEGIAPLAA